MYRKFIAALIFGWISHVIVSFSVIVANDRLPDRKKYPPLPDIILDNIVYVPWASRAAEYCLATLFFMNMFLLLVHKYRFVVLQRAGIMVGTLYLFRALCIMSTSIPVPDVHKQCDVFPDSDLASKLRRTWAFYSSMGMRMMGSHTCGDYIFSGHTVALTMFNLFINEYTPRSRYVLHAIGWILNFAGMVFILLCRGHYTIDVLIAFYITTQLFSFYHSLLLNRTLTNKKERTFTWVCFPIFNWLECENDENFKHEYELPRYIRNPLELCYKD